MNPPVLSQAEKEELGLLQPIPAEHALFEKTFGAKLSTCRDKLMSACGMWALDMLQFQLMLMEKHNYNPEDASMEGFVASTFGPGAAELLERLLGIKPALKETSADDGKNVQEG